MPADKKAQQFLYERAVQGVKAGDRGVVDVFLLLDDIERDGLERARGRRTAEEWDRLAKVAGEYGLRI